VLDTVRSQIVKDEAGLRYEVDRLESQVRSLKEDADTHERLLGIFLAVTAFALGLTFFILQYRHNGGGGWSWWEKVLDFAGAMFVGACAAVLGIGGVAVIIAYVVESWIKSNRRTRSAVLMREHYQRSRAESASAVPTPVLPETKETAE
jgi:hypothetical protein